MSRYKTTMFVLVAAVIMLAAGTPARAETVAARARVEMGTEVVRKQGVLPMWWRWMTMKIRSRYAMAAN